MEVPSYYPSGRPTRKMLYGVVKGTFYCNICLNPATALVPILNVAFDPYLISISPYCDSQL